MAQIIDKNDPEIQQLLEQCYMSTKIFAKTFFPHEVRSEFNSLHNTIYELIDDPYNKKAIAAPRGLGKTTMAKIRTCKAILFREVSFIVYLSNSAGSAEMQTEAIKRMLQSNDLIAQLFGDVKFSQEGFKDSFSKQSWVAYGDVFVLPRGAGQQVRGLNWMGNRPGLCIIDDLESTENVRSEDQREKLEDWFYSDLMETEDKYEDSLELIYIDTIKHTDSLLQNLIDASDWKSTVLSICDYEFNTFDPNYMTTEEIKEKYKHAKAKGKTDLFYMEMMNVPISIEDAVFKPEYFRYFEDEGFKLKVFSDDTHFEYLNIRDLITIVIVDPAKTVKMHSAESAVVTVSVDRQTHRIFVREIFSGKVRPDDLYAEMFSAVVRHNAFILAVEVTSLHEFISQPIENEMRIQNIYPIYLELNAKGQKEARVATLAPNYKLGYIYHNKTGCQVLENQLQWFPKSKLWDVMDALAYITTIMDDQAIYFDPEGDHEEPENYDELDDEDLMPDDWRVAV